MFRLLRFIDANMALIAEPGTSGPDARTMSGASARSTMITSAP